HAPVGECLASVMVFTQSMTVTGVGRTARMVVREVVVLARAGSPAARRERTQPGVDQDGLVSQSRRSDVAGIGRVRGQVDDRGERDSRVIQDVDGLVAA